MREKERDMSIAFIEIGMASYPLEPNESGQENCPKGNAGRPGCAA
jgi:hypothetical protein